MGEKPIFFVVVWEIGSDKSEFSEKGFLYF